MNLEKYNQRLQMVVENYAHVIAQMEVKIAGLEILIEELREELANLTGDIDVQEEETSAA